MRTFARHGHNNTRGTQSTETRGLVLRGGWRYDLHSWMFDTLFFRRQGHALRRRVLALAHPRPGARVLDVGCGTGTLALAAARQVGNTGRVDGIDPGAEQIARARARAARKRVPAEFQVGVIERLPFPDQTFDVVLSTLMMHHLGPDLKRQGLREIARVLKPGGSVIIADFAHKRERQGTAQRFHAGGSSLPDLNTFVTEAGFTQVEMEQMGAARWSAFPGAGIIRARKAQQPA